MTDPLAEQDDSSTPLSPEEREGLTLSYITLRGELNEAEQANILAADAWAFSRMVSIHCYPNGNGRHARLAADLLLTSLERDRFSWGSANLIDTGATRATYVAALRAADNHDYGALFAFVRS